MGLIGPSRRIQVEPVKTPAPARREPERTRERPPERRPERPAPDREKVPA
jgi:hypothetical protein